MESDKKNLNIVMMGFDRNDIGKGNYKVTMSKLDRDGLNPGFNNFLILFASTKNKREPVRNNPKFIAWHFYFLLKNRIIYDSFFILILPFILLYERIKPDLFYIYDFPHIFSVLIPKLFLRSKIYFRLVNLPTNLALSKERKGKFYFIYYFLAERMMYFFVDQFIVINETTEKYLLGLGVKKEKIIFDIPDTITRDREFIKKADKTVVRERFSITAEKKIAISIGSLIKEKGFFELIRVFSDLKRNDLALVICGEGTEKENLQKLCKELEIEDKVFFAGIVSREDIWSYLFGSDIFILFSKSESLGMVFWEAMHAKVPVVGTSVGGVKETIGADGERGFFFNDNINDLNEKIDVCLDNKSEEKRRQMIVRAKKYVDEKLSIKISINKIYNKKYGNK